MMMDCPRCGFSQPKDRFCASCGVDIEQFLRRPTPLWRRVLSNPNTYLFLVGVLLFLIVFFIVFSRGPAVWRAARGTFVTSREAADPSDDATEPAAAEVAAPTEVPAPSPPAVPAPPPVPPTPAATTAVAVEPTRIEAEFWEVARAPTIEIIATLERIADDQEGRAFVAHDAEKIRAWLRASARPLGGGLREALRAGAQLGIETPPGAAEALRFDFDIEVAKFENARGHVRFASALSLMQPETAAEMASPQPAMRAVIDTALRGHADLGAGDTLILLFHPVNRRPRPEFITRAGPGPWSIFASPNFRTGETDWIATIRLR